MSVLAFRPRYLARRHNPRPLLHLAAARPADQKWALLEQDLEYYRGLQIFPSDVFDTLEDEIKAQAGELAGVWNTQFIQAIYDSLEEALAAGTSPSDWLPEAAKLISAYGGATSLGIYSPNTAGDSFSAWYSDLVFRMATTNALNAGRYSEMFYGPSVETDPFWLFAASGNENMCAVCEDLDGRVFAKSDADGQQYLPSLHISCACQAIELDELGTKAGGYTVSSGASVGITLAPGFGHALDLVPDALRRAA